MSALGLVNMFPTFISGKDMLEWFCVPGFLNIIGWVLDSRRLVGDDGVWR
jgi:hypothetical protein